MKMERWMVVSEKKYLFVLAFVSFFISGVWLADLAAEELVWSEDIFAVTYEDADIKDVLTEIIKRNGQTPIFLPGVSGVVTFDFRDNKMPLKGALNKLMAEHTLTYSYDPENNSVKVLPLSSSAIVSEIFTPKHSTLDNIVSALKRFGMDDGSVRVEPDRATGSLFLSGVRSQVQEVVRLASKVDKALSDLGKRLKEIQDQELEQQRGLLEQEHGKLAIEAMQVEVKVIELRYISVGGGKTTNTEGVTVSLPSIVDTLEVLLGPVNLSFKNKQKKGEEKDAGKDSTTSSTAFYRGRSEPMISIDVRTNSVIVQGSPNQVKRIEEVVRRLDVPTSLVEIEVMIVDGSVDVTRQLGIKWGLSQVDGPNVSDVTVPERAVFSPLKFEKQAQTQTVVQNANGSSVVTTPADPELAHNIGAAQVLSSVAGLGVDFIYRGTREFLETKLDALAQDGALQTVASPRVVTLNNIAAQISNSTNFNFVVSTGDGTKADIQTVSTGISLRIKPSVIKRSRLYQKGLVRLEINATNSTPGAAGSDSVTTNDQRVQTNVVIPNGATFVMGGLFNTTRVETKAGVPLLKDIPYLGVMFGNTVSLDQKRETVFFITPKVYAFNQLNADQGAETRSYMEDQRFLLNEEREELQTKSRLLKLSQSDAAEDE